MPPIAKDQEIESQSAPGRTLTRPVPIAGRRRRSILGLMQGSGTDVLGRVPNPDDIGFETLNRMRQEPTISTGLMLLVAPILRQVRQATVKCEDPSIRRFIEATLMESGLWYTTIKQSLSALWAGMQACEKCWDVQDLELEYDIEDAAPGEPTSGSAWKGPALVIRELRDVNPETITAFKRRVAPPGSPATVDANGKPYDDSFDGFFWNDGHRPDAKDVWIPPQKAYVYAHQVEYGNLWGVPRTRGAYAYYEWIQFSWKAWMHWVDKKIVPPRIVLYEGGIDPETKLQNAELALDAADMLDTTNAIAFPSTRDDKGNLLWDVVEKPVSDRTATFKDTLAALAEQELFAMFVPPRVFSQNNVGSYSSTNAIQDIYLLTLDALLYDLTSNANAYMTSPLVVANFGTKAPKAEVITPGLTDAERARLEAVITSLLDYPNFLDRIDLDAVAKRGNIPLKAPAEPAPPGATTLPPAVPPDAGAVPPAAPAPAPPPAPGGPLPLPVAGPASNVAADDAIALAQGFDAQRWEIRPDPKSKLGYGVYDRLHEGHRIGGFSAAKVIESWKKASASAAKKQQADQLRAARQQQSAANKAAREQAAAQRKQTAEEKRAANAAAAAQKKAAAASAAETKRQQRESLKQQKQLERDQAAEAKRSQQHDQTVLTAARTERTVIESVTRHQDSRTAAQTFAAHGWQIAGGPYADRLTALTQAQHVAGTAQDHVFTVIQFGGGFFVVRKPKTSITLPKASPNVAASDEETDYEALLAAAAERLVPLMVVTPPEEDDDEEDDEA